MTIARFLLMLQGVFLLLKVLPGNRITEWPLYLVFSPVLIPYGLTLAFVVLVFTIFFFLNLIRVALGFSAIKIGDK